MGRERNLPATLSLERFSSGKDGIAKALRKKKQASKRKIFQKAQLKRQYAKLLKNEEAFAGVTQHREDLVERKVGGEGEPILSGVETDQGPRRKPRNRKRRRSEVDGTPALKAKGEGVGGEESQWRRDRESRGARREGNKQSKPDPYREAKAKAEERKRERELQQLKREQELKDKEMRAKKRRKQYALLSKRTRGGQPVMKNTIDHLLGKIQAQQKQEQEKSISTP